MYEMTTFLYNLFVIETFYWLHFFIETSTILPMKMRTVIANGIWLMVVALLGNCKESEGREKWAKKSSAIYPLIEWELMEDDEGKLSINITIYEYECKGSSKLIYLV